MKTRYQNSVVTLFVYLLLLDVLHWLPVRQRILYKVAITTFDCPAQPTSGTSVCPLRTSLGGHRLNAVTCWFLGPGPSSANGASMLQPPSSGTRCLHTCAQPPSVVNSSEMGWSPISSHRPASFSENCCLRVYRHWHWHCHWHWHWLICLFATLFIDTIFMEAVAVFLCCVFRS